MSSIDDRARATPVIDVRQGSVTDADVDVLVNASNTLGQLGSGVSAAIRRSCGPEFQGVITSALAARGGSMLPGDVLVTHAGAHPRAKHVVHVAVMDYRDSAPQVAPDRERIRVGSENLWRAIEELPGGPFSVGMVALGAGTGALGERMPTEVACATLKEHLERHPSSKIGRVVFHGFQLTEYVNVLDVVRKCFQIDLTNVPTDVREYLERSER